MTAKAEVEPMPEALEARVDAVMAAVRKQSLHREILYKTLTFCRERRELPDIEHEIATYPEFKYATQDQYHLITVLAEAGGLERFELDEEGGVVTDERKAGLSEDEIDDLVATYAYAATDAGNAVVERLDPQRRVRELLAAMPERGDAFATILEFCAESRTYKEIEVQFIDSSGEDDEDLFGIKSVYDQEDSVHPSTLVSYLEGAGALVWSDGWLRTDEGSAMLKTIKEEM